MNSILIDSCFYMLSSAACTSCQTRNFKKNINYDRIDRLLYNLSQALSLGLVFGTAAMAVTRENLSLRFFIPILMTSAISLATSGLTYIAHRNNCFSQKMEVIDQNLGKFMDIICRVSSAVLLILLVPYAPKSPIMFSLATGVILINSVQGYLS